jgi:hypothetical protein
LWSILRGDATFECSPHCWNSAAAAALELPACGNPAGGVRDKPNISIDCPGEGFAHKVCYPKL